MNPQEFVLAEHQLHQWVPTNLRTFFIFAANVDSVGNGNLRSV